MSRLLAAPASEVVTLGNHLRFRIGKIAEPLVDPFFGRVVVGEFDVSRMVPCFRFKQAGIELGQLDVVNMLAQTREPFTQSRLDLTRNSVVVATGRGMLASGEASLYDEDPAWPMREGRDNVVKSIVTRSSHLATDSMSVAEPRTDMFRFCIGSACSKSLGEVWRMRGPEECFR